MTLWIILRAGQPIYHTTSYPRFLVKWGEEQHTPGIDWTTAYDPAYQKGNPS